MSVRPTRRRIVALCVVALVVAACDSGDVDDPPAPSESPTASDTPQDSDADSEEPSTVDDGSEVAGIDLSTPLQLVQVAELGAPIAGAVGPDGSLFLADRSGTVHRLTDDGASGALVDVRADTSTDSERGLLGIAFSAGGSDLYLSRTDPAGDTVLEVVAVFDGVPLPTRRRTILQIEQPRANHNGGDVQVGPDGMVYLALGDGGGGGDPLEAGQDLSTPLGAILRIDPSSGDSYQVPGDNPFVSDPDAVDEIFVYGLRNPWRFSFDRETGEMWIADVGQNRREEVSVVDPATEAGANLGWNLREGTLEFAGPEPVDHHPPVHEYETTSSRCAITGGYVYRGEAIPDLTGAYLYSDFCDGEIRAILVEDGEVVAEADLGLQAGPVASFAQDVDGELYVLALSGAVYRIEPA